MKRVAALEDEMDASGTDRLGSAQTTKFERISGRWSERSSKPPWLWDLDEFDRIMVTATKP